MNSRLQRILSKPVEARTELRPAPPTRRTFAEPTSLEDAKTRRAALVQDALAIQMQLTAKKTVGHVTDAEWAEYQAWRKKAAFSLNVTQREMAFLKDWMRTHPVVRAAAAPAVDGVQAYDAADPLALLVAAAKTLRRLYDEVDWDVDPEERKLMEDLQAYCVAKGVSL